MEVLLAPDGRTPEDPLQHLLDKCAWLSSKIRDFKEFLILEIAPSSKALRSLLVILRWFFRLGPDSDPGADTSPIHISDQDYASIEITEGDKEWLRETEKDPEEFLPQRPWQILFAMREYLINTVKTMPGIRQAFQETNHWSVVESKTERVCREMRQHKRKAQHPPSVQWIEAYLEKEDRKKDGYARKMHQGCWVSACEEETRAKVEETPSARCISFQKVQTIRRAVQMLHPIRFEDFDTSIPLVDFLPVSVVPSTHQSDFLSSAPPSPPPASSIPAASSTPTAATPKQPQQRFTLGNLLAGLGLTDKLVESLCIAVARYKGNGCRDSIKTFLALMDGPLLASLYRVWKCMKDRMLFHRQRLPSHWERCQTSVLRKLWRIPDGCPLPAHVGSFLRCRECGNGLPKVDGFSSHAVVTATLLQENEEIQTQYLWNRQKRMKGEYMELESALESLAAAADTTTATSSGNGSVSGGATTTTKSRKTTATTKGRKGTVSSSTRSSGRKESTEKMETYRETVEKIQRMEQRVHDQCVAVQRPLPYVRPIAITLGNEKVRLDVRSSLFFCKETTAATIVPPSDPPLFLPTVPVCGETPCVEVDLLGYQGSRGEVLCPFCGCMTLLQRRPWSHRGDLFQCTSCAWFQRRTERDLLLDDLLPSRFRRAVTGATQSHRNRPRLTGNALALLGGGTSLASPHSLGGGDGGGGDGYEGSDGDEEDNVWDSDLESLQSEEQDKSIPRPLKETRRKQKGAIQFIPKAVRVPPDEEKFQRQKLAARRREEVQEAMENGGLTTLKEEPLLLVTGIYSLHQWTVHDLKSKKTGGALLGMPLLQLPSTLLANTACKWCRNPGGYFLVSVHPTCEGHLCRNCASILNKAKGGVKEKTKLAGILTEVSIRKRLFSWAIVPGGGQVLEQAKVAGSTSGTAHKQEK